LFSQKLAIFLFSVILITGSVAPSAFAQSDTPQAG